jgi:hypothetical protein
MDQLGTYQGSPELDRGGSVQQFLDRFARALTAGDGKTIARMWETPAFVLGDQEAIGVTSAAELEKFFGGARDQYNARGITDTRAEIQKLSWLTDRLALVEVRWPYLDARGQELGEERSNYVLRLDDDGELKMRAAIMLGGSQPH